MFKKAIEVELVANFISGFAVVGLVVIIAMYFWLK